jgi:hypothetical protein
MITYHISNFGNFVVLFVAHFFFIIWNNTDTCSFIFYLITGNQFCFRRVWFCKPLTEAEFSDNIKGLQPQIYFLGISYQQVYDINRKYLSLVLLYQQVYYFRFVMRLIYLLYSLELRLLLIRCFLSIGFKYYTPVFFQRAVWSLCQKWKSRVTCDYNVSLSCVGLESSRHTCSI